MAPKVKDITGQKFGRWTALEKADPTAEEVISKWRVRCDCGQEGEISKASLTNGRSKGCGCHREAKGQKYPPTRTYRCWGRMKDRCFNKRNERYKDYGARGIIVCERWLDFKNFLADMGECPDGFSIERLNVNGNYEPGNCEWADIETQANNRQGQKKYWVDGDWKTMTQAMRHWNVRKTEAKIRLQNCESKINGENNEQA